MMHIERLKIENLRIIQEMELTPDSGINVVVGNNGAGKTTILEAIHLLGKGQTFRHGEVGPLIRRETRRALVVGGIRSSRGQLFNLGVERETRGFRARKNGQEVTKRSELLRALPLQLLLPSSHDLVEREPELRRRFIDQALFHVEPDYHQILLEYSRALRHRNAALRNKQRAIARSFNLTLATLGERVTRSRNHLIELLGAQVNQVLGSLGGSFQIQLRYLKGWRAGDLREILEGDEERDLGRGYTNSGPHRGELKVTVEGTGVSRFLSRGQQKLVVYAICLSICEKIMEKNLEPPILLIDDFTAEFDKDKILSVLDYLKNSRMQVFLTTIGQDHEWMRGAKMFHVEQGGLVSS